MTTLGDLLPLNNGALLNYTTTKTATNNTTEAGVAIDRANQQYTTQTLPGLVNTAAGSGNFYGGQLHQDVGLAHEQLAQQVGTTADPGSGDIERRLAQTNAEMLGKSILATRGISI